MNEKEVIEAIKRQQRRIIVEHHQELAKKLVKIMREEAPNGVTMTTIPLIMFRFGPEVDKLYAKEGPLYQMVVKTAKQGYGLAIYQALLKTLNLLKRADQDLYKGFKKWLNL